MSTNTEVAAIFEDIARVLELTGANPFRINSYTRAARELRDLPDDVGALADEKKKLVAIDGIGDGTAKKIIEYVQTGKVAEHETLLATVPNGLFDVLRIPGLGPKSVKLMWEEAGVTDLDSLRAAMDAGTIEQLPRMGKKTVENIRKSIAFAAKAGDRTRIGKAMPIAEAIVERLRQVKGAKTVEYGGSLRRGEETIGDIDILAVAADPEALSEAFRTMDGVEQILAAGETKSSVRLDKGLQADLRIVPADSFGAAYMYFTGSKAHNVALRERAIKRGMRLNEYGLFPDDGDETPPQQRGIGAVASKTEKAVFEALDLPFIEPELRQDRGELTAEQPTLLAMKDIKAELHAHTIASDGKLTIDELAAEAKARGFHTIAVTDHSRSSMLAGGLDDDRLRAHIDAVGEANERTDGISILAGSEVDILVDGRLDYDDDLLAALDIVVASPHASLQQDRPEATARLLAAIRHPLVHIIGHPTGRIINRRAGLDLDIAAIIEAAVEHDTALEINANFFRLDLRDAHVRAVVEAGGLIAIDTDAHSAVDFEHLRYGVLTGRRGWLTKDRCVNCWSATKLGKWLKSKR